MMEWGVLWIIVPCQSSSIQTTLETQMDLPIEFYNVMSTYMYREKLT